MIFYTNFHTTKMVAILVAIFVVILVAILVTILVADFKFSKTKYEQNSKKMLNDYAEFSYEVEKKIDSLLPGPFTMILNRKKSNLSKLVYLDLSTIGVRIPNHNFPLEIVKAFKKPIITTSVNVHNQKSLNDFKEIKNQFKDIHIFVDEELKNNSKGSTIIDCTSEDFSILRMGDGVFK